MTTSNLLFSTIAFLLAASAPAFAGDTSARETPVAAHSFKISERPDAAEFALALLPAQESDAVISTVSTNEPQAGDGRKMLDAGAWINSVFDAAASVSLEDLMRNDGVPITPVNVSKTSNQPQGTRSGGI